MMVAPHHLPILIAKPDHCDAHKRSLVQIELAHPIGGQEFLQPWRLGLLGHTAPIFFLHIDPGGLRYNLYRILQASPNEAAAQCPMPVRKLLPRPLERADLQVSMQSAAHLLDIESGLRREQGMEKNSFLPWSGRIDIFNFCAGSAEFVQGFLGKLCQWEVRRSVGSCSRRLTVGDQSREIFHKARSYRFDLRTRIMGSMAPEDL